MQSGVSLINDINSMTLSTGHKKKHINVFPLVKQKGVIMARL